MITHVDKSVPRFSVSKVESQQSPSCAVSPYLSWEISSWKLQLYTKKWRKKKAGPQIVFFCSVSKGIAFFSCQCYNETILNKWHYLRTCSLSNLKACRLETQKRTELSTKRRKSNSSLAQSSQTAEFPFIDGRVALLFLLRLWTDWRGAVHICFTQSSDLNASVILKHHQRHIQNNISPNVWVPCGPCSLTYAVIDHRLCSIIARCLQNSILLFLENRIELILMFSQRCWR